MLNSSSFPMIDGNFRGFAETMDLRKCASVANGRSVNVGMIDYVHKINASGPVQEPEEPLESTADNVDIDLSEIYFLVMHFLSAGPCKKTFSQLRDELLEHELLPKRYHAWHSRSGAASNGGNSVGKSFPLSYDKLVERYSHIENDHLVQLLKQLMLMTSPPLRYIFGRDAPSASDVPTLLGTGSFSLLSGERGKVNNQLRNLPSHLRWPHKQANQVQGLRLREIGGGFSKHHRAPSMRLACYAIAKPSTVVPKLQNMKKLRGHRDAVYCAIFDHSGRYVITGSDDRLVKIWSMDTAFCLASCRGHEGDITDLSVSLNNATVASASNDYTIRVWRLPDGYPISVLRGHTGTVTAIAFSPRASTVYMLLSSSEDGTCRLWDARYSHLRPHIYLPKPTDTTAGICSGLPSAGASSSVVLPSHQILCCAFNASGTVFVTGSSDTFARVWSARRPSMDDPEQPSHEIDILAGHENDVNYVQFSGCSVASRFSPLDSSTEDSIPKFRNSGFNQDNIVTCSRDGTAIIWIPRSRRSHGKAGRWIRAYHLKVPPPPMPPQPPRGGPRQRLLPTPRGVNMIVWSLDNRFVLAAIMDNRICVWNANDGSLVHSLAGHTASTYVLDVHPFNPRIAMSAGYDGKAILWDIWEGTPIRVYEIGGRFKLVDGKFSQDGTSILLSDDVGQIYLLSTGEGESHKDAKYDQFFLGDYRPLAQDAYGNVVDQETQLVPHRRNLQDPLCDSSMLPYPEPYQSMYQKRRLGALGIEWSPSSIKFAVGTDIGIGQDFHILPLADLEGAFEPLPDYVDAVFWEPENDVINDDNDSEFNITEEYFSEEPTCDSDSTSSDSGSHEDNNKVRRSRRDNMHRPNKKKSLRDGEVTTSLGRRAKKRTSDEQEGSSSRQKRRKKIKPGQRASRKKSAKSKSLRSRRTAARNANNSFSQITEASADDEDVDFSSGETSETESSFEGSDSQEEGEDFCNSQKQPSAATGITLIGSQDVVKPNNNNPDSRPGDANRKKLVVKFSLHGRATPTFSENNDGQAKNPVNGAPSSIKGCENKQEGMFNPKAEDICSSSASLVDKEQSFFKQQPEDAEEATGGNELRTNTSCSDIRTSWGKLKMHISSDVRRDDVSPLDENTKRNDGSLPTGSDEMSSSLVISPITGHQLTNNDSVGLNKQKFEAVEDELPREPPPIAKKKLPVFKIKARKFLGDSSPNLPSKTTSVKFPVEEKQTLGGSSVVSKYEPHYNGDEVYDSDSHVSLHDRETKGGSPERKTDSAHRARSLRLKITSPEIDRSNYKSETGALYLQPGTSKNLGRSFANALDHLPSERSTSAGRSRSSRSRRDDQYEKDDSPLVDGNIPQMSRKTNWLLLTKHEEGCRYIPQLGDEVVYLQQGHREYVERTSQTQPSTPRLRSGDKLRAAEVCLVEDLSYTTVPGSGESCCQIKLKFIDNSCAVFGKSFTLSLPELADFPDFIVERTQYDAAINKNWKVRDKCRVWWRNENGHGGDWWDGRIIAIKDDSPDFLGSPWERYVVKYPNDTADYRHCPWELHDPERPWEHPNIDVESKTKLLHSLTTSKNKDRYGILKLNEVAEKLDFVNRFPVPLSPRIIISRLENDYYRSVMAVEHDIQVMSKNGESYFLKNTELRRKMIQLRQTLLSAL